LRYWILAPKSRAGLHEQIARRFEAMMAAGFLDEVIGLRRSKALSARHPSMRAVATGSCGHTSTGDTPWRKGCGGPLRRRANWPSGS